MEADTGFADGNGGGTIRSDTSTPRIALPDQTPRTRCPGFKSFCRVYLVRARQTMFCSRASYRQYLPSHPVETSPIRKFFDETKHRSQKCGGKQDSERKQSSGERLFKRFSMKSTNVSMASRAGNTNRRVL
jgi:hypothetical protein